MVFLSLMLSVICFFLALPIRATVLTLKIDLKRQSAMYKDLDGTLGSLQKVRYKAQQAIIRGLKTLLCALKLISVSTAVLAIFCVIVVILLIGGIVATLSGYMTTLTGSSDTSTVSVQQQQSTKDNSSGSKSEGSGDFFTVTAEDSFPIFEVKINAIRERMRKHYIYGGPKFKVKGYEKKGSMERPDCSGFQSWCAGVYYTGKAGGASTGGMDTELKGWGFKVVKKLERGCIVVDAGHHTEMYWGNFDGVLFGQKSVKFGGRTYKFANGKGKGTCVGIGSNCHGNVNKGCALWYPRYHSISGYIIYKYAGKKDGGGKNIVPK